jgi:hypothetical protein
MPLDDLWIGELAGVVGGSLFHYPIRVEDGTIQFGF